MSNIFLALYVFLQSAGYLGWFVAPTVLLGVVGLVTVFLLLFEGGPAVYKRYTAR